MSLKEKLLDLEGAVGGVATCAPDDYPEWSYRSYEYEKADLLELLASIRPQIKIDQEKLELVEGKIRGALAALDCGEKEKGRDLMWEVYNLDVKTMR